MFFWRGVSEVRVRVMYGVWDSSVVPCCQCDGPCFHPCVCYAVTGVRCPAPAHSSQFPDADLSFSCNVCVLFQFYVFRLLLVCLVVFCFFFLCGFSMNVWHHVLGEGMLFDAVFRTPGHGLSFISRVGFCRTVWCMVTWSFYVVFVLGPSCGVCDCWLVFMSPPMRYIVTLSFWYSVK